MHQIHLPLKDIIDQIDYTIHVNSLLIYHPRRVNKPINYVRPWALYVITCHLRSRSCWITQFLKCYLVTERIFHINLSDVIDNSIKERRLTASLCPKNYYSLRSNLLQFMDPIMIVEYHQAFLFPYRTTVVFRYGWNLCNVSLISE